MCQAHIELWHVFAHKLWSSFGPTRWLQTAVPNMLFYRKLNNQLTVDSNFRGAGQHFKMLFLNIELCLTPSLVFQENDAF